MASGSAKGDVKVWEFGSRRLISQRQEHVAAVTGIQIIESGAVVVTCSKDTSCKYFNLRAGISGVFFVMDASRLNSLCVTPDENLLVSVGSDKYLTVWDLAQTETLLSVQAHEAEATCLALSPDSALVVTGGADRVLRLWDVRTGYMLSVLEGHCGRVSCVEFISETKIVSADGNGSVILWDVHI
jgi:WD40 repeat protein